MADENENYNPGSKQYTHTLHPPPPPPQPHTRTLFQVARCNFLYETHIFTLKNEKKIPYPDSDPKQAQIIPIVP